MRLAEFVCVFSNTGLRRLVDESTKQLQAAGGGGGLRFHASQFGRCRAQSHCQQIQKSGKESQMNIRALLHNAVRCFRGPQPEDSNGAVGLSGYMGLTSTSLSHKVSPTYPSAHCSPEEVIAICQLTGDHAPIQAMAKALGYVLVPIAQEGTDTDQEYIEQLTAAAREFGEYLAESTSSYADKRITDPEMTRITKEFADSMAAQARLFAILQAKHRAGKPASERRHLDLPVRAMREEAPA